MFLLDYQYVLGEKPRLNDYIKEFDFDRFQLNGGAFIYVGSSFEHYSAAGNYGIEMKKTMPIKAQASVLARTVAVKLGDVDYMSINANACASGLSALHEARKLMDEYDEVVLYGEELTTDMQRLMFKQVGIDIEFCSGAFILKLSKTEGDYEIPATSWKFDSGNHPFDITKEGYKKAIGKVSGYNVDIAKGHFSTYSNDPEEIEAIDSFYPDVKKVAIKKEIGHSQGLSAIIEMLYLKEHYEFDSALITSSGLGGFYGSCIFRKRMS